MLAVVAVDWVFNLGPKGMFKGIGDFVLFKGFNVDCFYLFLLLLELGKFFRGSI